MYFNLPVYSLDTSIKCLLAAIAPKGLSLIHSGENSQKRPILIRTKESDRILLIPVQKKRKNPNEPGV